MFVNELKVGSVQERVISQPTWDAVVASIGNLDGVICDGVALNGPNSSYMNVSGGEDGRYVVGGYLEGFGEFICASGFEGGPARDVVVAGDYNKFESKHVIDIETALLAAKAFFETGVLSNELRWEKEG